MSNWFYFNKTGEKVGPISTTALKSLARQGLITPETKIENANGRSAIAGSVNGLEFPASTTPTAPIPPAIVPPSVNGGVYGMSEPRPFVTPPVETNPFVSSPTEAANPFSAALPVSENPFTGSVTVDDLEPVSNLDDEKPATPILLIVCVLVVGIMFIGGIIFAVLRIGSHGTRIQAKIDSAALRIKVIVTSLELYEMGTGRLPTTEQGLEALLERPDGLRDASKWNGPYLDDGSTIDPWGNPYQYAIPGIHSRDGFDVWSMGPDGIDGTEDDIGNGWGSTTYKPSPATFSLRSRTLDSYNKIENGMSYAQVVALVGKPTSEMADSEMPGIESEFVDLPSIRTTVYMWEVKDSLGANFNVTFQNDKVVMKAQAGLK